MKSGLMFLVCVLAAVCGCASLAGTWVAPINQSRLDAAARKSIEAKDAEIAQVKEASQKATAALKAEVEKLKINKPTPLWPLYLIGALALAFGLGVGYLFKAIGVGVMFALGGAASIATAQFIERYPWFMWIPVGVGTVAGAFFLYDWYRGVRAKRLTEILIPAIEAGEPKRLGDAPSGPVKSAVAAIANREGLKALVEREVANAKLRMRIK